MRPRGPLAFGRSVLDPWAEKGGSAPRRQGTLPAGTTHSVGWPVTRPIKSKSLS